MTFQVGQVGSVGIARPAQNRARGNAGFQVPEGGAGLAPAGGVGPVCTPSMLALQEEEEGQVADRDARRHGQAMLAALAALQRLALGDGSADGALEQLASLVRATPDAADPRLAAVQRAIQVRVAVELARGRAAARG